MIYQFSEEQEALRDAIRSFLASRAPLATVMANVERGGSYDDGVWQAVCRELGVQGVIIPEQYGGLGLGWVDLAVVLEEMGYALYAGPFYSTMALATTAILASEDAQAAADWLPSIATGATTGALAVAEAANGWELDAITTRGVAEGDSWRLHGKKAYVVDGATADLLIVLARTEQGPSLFLVEAGAPGLVRHAEVPLDQTRGVARIELAGTPARLLGREGDGMSVTSHVLDIGTTMLAVEQLGGARRCLDMAADYAKSRVQFGRPIGSFQAIKHKLADNVMTVETMKSAAYYAAWMADTDHEELPKAASIATWYCSEGYFSVAAENIQVHGGIGFTWEHYAHLFFKRAEVSKMLFGSPSDHREVLAERIGL